MTIGTGATPLSQVESVSLLHKAEKCISSHLASLFAGKW